MKYYRAPMFDGLIAVAVHVCGEERFLQRLSLAPPTLMATIISGKPTVESVIMCAGMGVSVPVSQSQVKACEATIEFLRSVLSEDEMMKLKQLMLILDIKSSSLF
jgi:hypothetical protein